MTRNCYVLWLPARLVCTLLGNWRHQTCIALPFLQEAADCNGNRVVIPDDYVCEDANHDWQRKSIGLLISHPSFPTCVDGEMFPNLYYRAITVQALPIVETKCDPDSLESIIVQKDVDVP